MAEEDNKFFYNKIHGIRIHHYQIQNNYNNKKPKWLFKSSKFNGSNCKFPNYSFFSMLRKFRGINDIALDYLPLCNGDLINDYSLKDMEFVSDYSLLCNKNSISNEEFTVKSYYMINNYSVRDLRADKKNEFNPYKLINDEIGSNIISKSNKQTLSLKPEENLLFEQEKETKLKKVTSSNDNKISELQSKLPQQPQSVYLDTINDEKSRSFVQDPQNIESYQNINNIKKMGISTAIHKIHEGLPVKKINNIISDYV